MVLFYGGMDNITFNESKESSVLTLTITDHLIDWNRSRNGRYTGREQKLIDSTDTGLDHLEEAIKKYNSELEIDWRPYD